MIDHKKISLANQVFEAIERNILSGVYKSGEVLSETKLSKELGVSRTPVREALGRLEREMLVATTSVGTVVKGITTDDVKDMYFVKDNLEPKVFRMAAENISEEGLEQLKHNVEQQEFYVSRQDYERVRNLDTEFHDLIYTESGSPVLFSILSPNHHKLLKFRRDSLALGDRCTYAVAEHMEIYKAIAERDADKAEELARKHIKNAQYNLEKEMK